MDGGFFYPVSRTLAREGATGRPLEAAGPASREELPMFPRKAAVLAVTLTLALPWCAAVARPAFSLPAYGQASASLEQLRAGFWSWLRGVWTKEGCGIDPGGKLVCGPTSTGGTKGGCGLDPDGKPACGPTSLGGPEPPAPTGSTDGGCGLDPSGSPCGGRQ